MGKQRYRGIRSIIIGAALILIWADGLPAEPLRENVNLPGMDYRNFSLPSPDPKLCEQACSEDPKCMAFTYVKPGVQGREARCWLKSAVPGAVRDSCCVSGVKAAETRTPPSAATLPSAAVERTQQRQLPKAVPEQVQKPASLPIEQKPIAPPALGQQFEQFRITSANQLQALNRKEEQIKESLFEQVRRDIQAVVSAGSQPARRTGEAAKAGGLPQITDILPKSGKPGSPILIQGYGFPSYPEVVLYDPTGGVIQTNPSSNAVTLTVKKWTSDSIEAELPRVNYGLAPFNGPREVLIRVRDSYKKQYSNNSPPFTLVPNTAIYIYYPGKPVNIQKNGTQVIWQHGATMWSATVFHLSSTNWPSKGTDTLVQNLKTPQGWALAGFELGIVEIYCYDPKKGDYEPFDIMSPKCSISSDAKLDQDLKKIDGQTFIPKASVSWETGYYGGIAYCYVIYVRGPEGWAGPPF